MSQSAHPLAHAAMPINSKGFRLLILVSICMLLSSWLPAHYKLWFVSETGNVGHGQSLDVLVILLLFGRWKHARSLALFVNGLQFLFGALILFTAWKWGSPWLGYSLTTLLHLVALKVLNDSASVREFLEEKQLA
ncbi:hypothetical protein MUN81_19015 [Hymenobacter sp. 5317J-9]|uniref:hypothetical protein n=1 Tax=Hymenobacter sp. 5317J-9 TaxID=2932250 RepID=UPI001FD6C20A|nr:hypothetical protein [Hymenobacter sp. 5317J-9]UOQ97317.1 hypothetical protein MUN81_19015 [Hymenobacter sp. 5317J-9]